MATRPSIILALLVSAQFIVVLDFSIVQIALPTMRTELNISLADSQWIVSAYGITFSGLLLLSGRVSDVYGRRKLFSTGLLIFALASLAGGLAPSELILIASRAAQGVGAAIASATGLTLLEVSFPEGKERNRALSIFAAVSSAGFAAGVILGGSLTATLGWRSIFFVNVPIGIAAALLAPRVLAESKVTTNRQLDLPGALTVTAGLSLLVYGLTEAANTSLFSASTLSLLGLAAIVMFGFLVIEDRSKAPLVPLGFVRRANVFAANSLALITTAAFGALIFLLTIYLQQIQGYSALSAGLAFLPTALVFLVAGGYLSARLVARFGVRPVLVAGMVIMAVGFLMLSQISVDTPFNTGILPTLLFISFGGAIDFTAFNIAALTGAGEGEEGLASGLINTSTQVGGPIGLAISVTVVGVIVASLGGGQASNAALVSGFGYAFVGAAAMSGLGAAIAASVRRPRVVVETTEAESLRQHQPIVVQPSTVAPAAAPSKALTTLRRILVAVDGSENGRRAAIEAARFARDYSAELIVLRAVPVPTMLTSAIPRASSGPAILKDYYRFAEDVAKRYVDGLVAELKGTGVQTVRGEVVRTGSSPASSIVGRARAERVDLIVIGSRGLDRSKRLLLGSVSADVAANSKIATLVIK